MDVPAATSFEYHVVNPQIKVALRNAAMTSSLCCDRVEVRTKGRNSATDSYWASAQLSPPCVGISLDGNLSLPLPALPGPGDVNESKRSVCYAACEALPSGDRPTDRGDPLTHAAAVAYDEAVKGHNLCISVCDGNWPKPPSLPNLPTSISIRIEVVIK